MIHMHCFLQFARNKLCRPIGETGCPSMHRAAEKMRSRQFVNRAGFGSPGPSIRVALGFDACHPVCGGKWCPAGHAGQEGGRVELCTLRYGATRA